MFSMMSISPSVGSCRRGPDALSLGDLDAGLEPAVRLAELAGGQHPTGRVLTASVPALVVGRVLLASRDRQVALAVLDHVARRVRVVLALVVAEAAATEVELPFRGVDRGAGPGVELVRPGDTADCRIGIVMSGGGDETAGQRDGDDAGSQQDPGFAHGGWSSGRRGQYRSVTFKVHGSSVKETDGDGADNAFRNSGS
jgi:hypothetical protein